MKVEFNGYISGNAEKYFWKKEMRLGQNIILISMVLCFPISFILSRALNNDYFVIGYLLLVFICPLLCRIPKRKKEKIRYIPYRVYIEDGYIICCTQVQEEVRNLEDVKQVNDFGEWYSLVFHVGKLSNSFICQKDLLSAGTIEEFEKIFANKIVCKIAK